LGILETVLPSFLIIGAAFLLQRAKNLELKPLIETALYLASPCLIFSSLSSKAYSPLELLPIVAAAVVVVLGSLVLARLIFSSLRLGDVDARTLPVVLINAGNLGIPISLFAFGEEALGIVIMFFVTSAIFTYTLGIYLAARGSSTNGGSWSEVFKLPLIYAAALGVGASLFNIQIPLILSRAIDLLAQAAIPLFLVSLGMSLARISPRKDLPSALLSASMRIALGLFLGVASVNLLGLQGASRGVVILQSSMPPAVASFMLSKKYRCNPELVASTVLVGTLMSLVTIPLVLQFLT